MIRRSLWTVVASLAFLCAGTAHAQEPLRPRDRYVAIGSSFGAGPWIGEPADLPVNRCDRSQENYAHLLARKLRLDLVDVTCGGATSAHILGAWDELPAQIEAVTPDTRLVTITMGGNDLNYIGWIGATTCGRMSPRDVATIFGGRGCPAPRLTGPSDDARLAQNLTSVVERIRAIAPRAKVILLDYPVLMPASGNCTSTGLTDDEVLIAHGIGNRLKATVKAVAADTHVEYLSLDEKSVGHDICAVRPWVNGAQADRSKKDGAYFHPNGEGMAQTARMLASVVKR